jgi:hypothetical protein
MTKQLGDSALIPEGNSEAHFFMTQPEIRVTTHTSQIKLCISITQTYISGIQQHFVDFEKASDSTDKEAIRFKIGKK